MKKIIALLLFVFIHLNGISQQTPLKLCDFDEYIDDFLDNHPQYNDTLEEIAGSTAAFRTLEEQDAEFTIYIPVVFHVVYDYNHSERNISDLQIQSQLVALNSSFAYVNNHPSGVNARIIFCLANRDPYGNITTGITRFSAGQASYVIGPNSSDESSLKAIDNWPSIHYLNIWVCNLLNSAGTEVLPGHASFPFTSNGLPISPTLDGIMLHYEYCGNNIGTATVPNYSTGKILVHEAGHWLGLFHVFYKDNPQGDCSNCKGSNALLDGDMIVDTDPCRGPALSDPYWQTGTDRTKRYSCNSSCLSDMPIISAENYMDYNWTQHMNFFTAKQRDRMHQICKNYRSYFYDQSKRNPGLLPIECNSNTAYTGTSLYTSYGCFDNCTVKKYPDEWLRMNGNETPYVNLCIGTIPVLNFYNSSGYCSLFPPIYHKVECTDQAYFEGNCHNFDHCTQHCEMVGACTCYEPKREIYLKVMWNCDANWNCSSEKSAYWLEDRTPCNFDVFSNLDLHLQNTPGRYKIQIGTTDVNGNNRTGTKYLTYYEHDMSLPASTITTPTVVSAAEKVLNDLFFINNAKIPTNSTYVANHEIYMRNESSTNGNIESELKIDAVFCSNAIQRPVRIDTNSINNGSPPNAVASNEGDFNDTYNYYFKNSSVVETNELTLAPNPSDDGKFNFYFEKKVTLPYKIKIYTSSMQHLATISSNELIDLSTYADGIYFIEFNLHNKLIYKKALKNK